MGLHLGKELKLAQALKSSSDASGKEVDPNESAEILHQFGLLYMEKSPDKISLIRSAVFFNAALTRQPDNEVFKEDLRQLCFHVLQVARAEQIHSDLLEIASRVSKHVLELRSYTAETLQKVEIIYLGSEETSLQELKEQKTKQIKELQTVISAKYTDIMDYVSRKCTEIMGFPPCKYSITGMGSLARNEVTPYSDFEHIIVLEEGVQGREDYEDILEYFRWFSVVFQIIIIGLRETIIRAVAVPLLNDGFVEGGDWFFDDHTTCGIKFDGMQIHACKFPLGRTQLTEKRPWTIELIKPISLMVKYLESDEDLKNGYHLADILTKTCFVSGNKNVHREFRRQARITLCDRFSHKQLLTEIDEDLRNFDTFKNTVVLFGSSRCNIKRVIYRSSTIFISSFSRLYSIDKSSSFDIVDAMLERKLIREETANHLAYAVAIACEIRLRVYMGQKGQDDFVGDGSLDKKSIHHSITFIGEQSYIDYFTITYSLQQAIKKGEIKNMKISENTWKYFSLKFFELVGGIVWISDDFKRSNTPDADDDDVLMLYAEAIANFKNGNFEKSLETLESLSQRSDAGPIMQAFVLMNKANCYCALDRYMEAIDCVGHGTKFTKDVDLPQDEKSYVLGNLTCAQAASQYSLKFYSEAFSNYDKALQLYKKAKNFIYASKLQIILYYKASCLLELGNIDDALSTANETLTLLEKEKTERNTLIKLYDLMSTCCKKKLAFTEAINFFSDRIKLSLDFSFLQYSMPPEVNVKRTLSFC